MNKALIACGLCLILAVSLSADEVIEFTDSWGQHHLFNLVSQSPTGVEIVFSLHRVVKEEMTIDGQQAVTFGVPGIFLFNDEGAPNLPGTGRYIAIPQGATAELKVLQTRTQVYRDVEIAPAPRIPLENDDSPLQYKKNMAIYGRDAYYPDQPVKLSEPMQIRGVDAVIVGVTPFQYNPVTKELIVYTDLRIRVDFKGGNGHFGEDRLRSPYWEPILQGHLLNYQSLPEIDFYSRLNTTTTEGCDYIIIVPNDPDFIAWADTLARWRNLQGIWTKVFTLSQVGGTDSARIKQFLRTAYNSWTPAPSAFLLLSDFSPSGLALAYGITSPRVTHPEGTMASDNWYADFNNDNLPDMHHGRICAQNAAQLSVMIGKMLAYERNPYNSANFYLQPLVACGWQTERWFQLCSEVIRGFFIRGLDKNPQRQYAIYSGTPTVGGSWSTATNTATVVNFWNSVGWLTSTTNQQNASWWSNGSAAGINNAINSGAFILQHRDHGFVGGWGEPSYDTTSLNGLDNSMHVFVFSTNCETGYFDHTRRSFTEKFHRISAGALGVNAATRVSYSFVNDTYVWGIYDGMWQFFNPSYPTPDLVGPADLRPCLGMTYGKYFLQASNWPYNTSNKVTTYGLFHHHGDVFMRLNSEVPVALTVSHAATIAPGETQFTVTANSGAVIALTKNYQILAAAQSTGAPVTLTIPPLGYGDTMIVTVTKANYRRYSAPVVAWAPGLTYLTGTPVGSLARVTAIGAQRDTAIVLFERTGQRLGCCYLSSADGGANWSLGHLGDTNASSSAPAVVAKEGGIGVAYRYEGSWIPEGRFLHRPYSGDWCNPQPFSDQRPAAIKPAIEYLGQTNFGVLYVSDAPSAYGAAFFDRRFTGFVCSYTPGDFDGNDVVNATDVSYAAAFFKGLGPAPPDSCFLDSLGAYLYVAGDVNGNCEVSGADLVRLVYHLKGQADISYCPLAPPQSPRYRGQPPGPARD